MPDYGPPTTPPPPPDTVTLGGGAWRDPKEGRPSRKWWYVGGGTVVAVALIAGGTVYAATQLRAQHDPGAAAGLPSDTLAYAALDLDPSAGQKIEAIKALRKFPAFASEVKVDPSVDLRKLMVQDDLKSDGCKLDWDKDVAPWLGNDLGGAMVPTSSNGPQPVAVVAVTDEAAAKKQLPKLLACGDAGSVGLSVAHGWAVVAASDSIAEGVTDDAQGGSLADDADFKTWVDRTGDPGVATLYASKSAGTELATYLDKAMSQLDSFGATSDSTSTGGGFAPAAYTERTAADDLTEPSLPADPFGGDDPFGTGGDDPFSMFFQMCPGAASASPSTQGLDQEKKQLADFQGGAATLRFSGGGFEVETAASGKGSSAASTDAPATDLASLPADTAIAYGAAFDPGVFDKAVDAFVAGFAQGCGSTPDKVLGELNDLTGLQLPQDLKTVFGHGATFAVSGALDPAAFDSPTVPTHDFPAGFRLHGDPGQIAAALKKLPGTEVQQLLATTPGDGTVAVGPDAAYRAELLKKGSLGSSSAFKDVIPHADKAGVVAFVDFAQLSKIVARSDDPDAKQAATNMAHLSSLGSSAWVEGGISHGLMRIGTR